MLLTLTHVMDCAARLRNYERQDHNRVSRFEPRQPQILRMCSFAALPPPRIPPARIPSQNGYPHKVAIIYLDPKFLQLIDLRALR